MVDSVNFRPAKPVPLSHVVTQRDTQPSRTNDAVVSPHTQSLSLASALAQMGPPFDAGKVDFLKAAIANGSYRIDLGAIADGIIRFGMNEKA
jgi:flagellar biosynthesis anti-sigma factor FlgM